METRRHRIELSVGPEDVDDLGHVNNLVYLHWIEACFREHALKVGLSTERMRSLGTLPVVRKHVVTYRSSAREGDRLVVSTEVTRVRGPLARRYNTVSCAESGRVLVEVETDWVWVDVSTGRPKAPAEEVVVAFGIRQPAGDGQSGITQ